MMREAISFLGVLVALTVSSAAIASDPKRAPAVTGECDTLAALDLRTDKGVLSVSMERLNSEAAIAACRKATEQFPDARFRFQLGRALEKAGSFQLAIDQYQAAADSWFAPAIYAIGHLYADGRGLPKDFSKAVTWYNKAAERGEMHAQYELGHLCRYGHLSTPGYRYFAGFFLDPVEKAETSANYECAAAWYMRAAEQGHAAAQLQLAQLYRAGTGVTKDTASMLYWYTQAANQGMPEAQAALGWVYLTGHRVKADMPYAAGLFGAAAAQGLMEAQSALAGMYKHAHGVEYDLDKAIYWYSMAAAQGDKNAAKDADEIRAAVKSLNAYMQKSPKQFAIYSAKSISGVPGALVCDSHDRVGSVFDLYVNYWEEYEIEAKLSKVAKEQNALLYGKKSQGAPPNIGDYGCEMADPGVRMYMEIGNLVPVVVFITSENKLFRGVTLEPMLKP